MWPSRFAPTSTEISTLSCGDPGCAICYSPKPPEPQLARPVVFDEQLRLVGPDGQPARHLPYGISLGDGTKHTGTTDGDGRTMRITTSKPTSVMSITMTPPSSCASAGCCNVTSHDMALERIYVQSITETIATTNDVNVGASVAEVRIPAGKKRQLTSGEIRMARMVFGRGIDYDKVWVHHGGWWLFMGMQDAHTAVTPNGEMYYPKAIYQHDFSSSSIDPRNHALFIHEMTHVWQYQMGYPVKWRGLTVTSRGKSAYVYSLAADSRLCDFNMEQQGNIFSDYFMICVLDDPDMAFNPGKSKALLRQVMKPFIENPLDKHHLPQ